MSDKIREEEERARRSLKFKHSSVRTSKSPQSAQPQYLALKSAGVAPMKRRLVKSAPEAHLVARQGERGDQDADDESSLQLLRKRELAALLKVSPWTVDRWRRRADFPLPALDLAQHTRLAPARCAGLAELPAARRAGARLEHRPHQGSRKKHQAGATQAAANTFAKDPRMNPADANRA